MVKIHPGICHCPSNFSRKCNCLSEVQTCSACLHMPGESDWYDRCFNSTVEPLQRPQDPMSSDALILWLGLEGVKSEKEVENKQQQLIKAPPPCPLGHVVSNYRFCAVVGNSRSLWSSGLGFRINQHEVVLRTNQAPVQGFEADVGNRTTMRIMYPGIASPQDPGIQLLLLPLNSSGLDWFISVLHKQTSMWKQKNPGYVREGGHCRGDKGDSKDTLAGYWGTPKAYLRLKAACQMTLKSSQTSVSF
uniref:CMP-N-acetylneuraminate-beta-galactosamide- alpha-2,3-sialyltransferase 1-like isoform X1 n=1 Tax=Macaca mulatta TaxID=9544 RepID=UPI0007328647|nr:CMP-N-acetylneuraminate-beta-galactosamide-alpha-2,3-sialyltransferase 1-like isoform X1 [Macaca mulatta]